MRPHSGRCSTPSDILREDQFVGVVLNQSDTVSGSGYGYGYYGHMYKYGSSSAETE